MAELASETAYLHYEHITLIYAGLINAIYSNSNLLQKNQKEISNMHTCCCGEISFSSSVVRFIVHSCRFFSILRHKMNAMVKTLWNILSIHSWEKQWKYVVETLQRCANTLNEWMWNIHLLTQKNSPRGFTFNFYFCLWWVFTLYVCWQIITFESTSFLYIFRKKSKPNAMLNEFSGFLNKNSF